MLRIALGFSAKIAIIINSSFLFRSRIRTFGALTVNAGPPWNCSDFAWKYGPRGDASQILQDINDVFEDCDESTLCPSPHFVAIRVNCMDNISHLDRYKALI